jgi:uncharacterized protein
MGTILRLLIIAAIIWFIYSLIRRAITPPPEQQPLQNPPLMRQCAHCHVNIPEGESTQSHGRFFCCEAHRDLYLQQKP